MLIKFFTTNWDWSLVSSNLNHVSNERKTYYLEMSPTQVSFMSANSYSRWHTTGIIKSVLSCKFWFYSCQILNKSSAQYMIRTSEQKGIDSLSKFWAHEINSINFVVLFINLFLVISIVSRGLIRTIKHTENLIPLGLDEMTETS